MHPFQYPNKRHRRRHGPKGYNSYESYRPWLRDEFSFRCVYCLKREQWGMVRANYNIDHFYAQCYCPESILDYDNLVYCCANCNSAKRDWIIPNPCECLIDGDVVVHEDGRIESKNANAQKLIRILGLDDTEYREFRLLWLGIVELARHFDPELYRTLMKYPDDLPDLEALRPPENTRPDGVKQCFRSRQMRNELPEFY